MSRRDGAIVAWHEVPGSAPPQKSRPVGYGLIPAGVRTRSMQLCLAAGLWRIQRWDLAGSFQFIEQQPEHHRTRTFQETRASTSPIVLVLVVVLVLDFDRYW